MNRFRDNLHQAFFDGLEKGKTPEIVDNLAKEEAEKKAAIDQARMKEQVLEESVRRNNEAQSSSTVVETKEEKEQTEEDVTKQLEKQLNQLAKNKKIDFPWTDNARTCSRAEKRLATSSVKVFMQLLDSGKLSDMINKCKSYTGELSEQDAEAWKSELGVNSRTKDIQNFYKAFKEYQDSQSQYQHLKNLMGFLCETDFKNKEGVRKTLETRSEKISKQDLINGGKMLYQEGWVKDSNGNERYVIKDAKTGEEIDRKPKDWKQRASFEVIKFRLEGADISQTDKMLTLLGDFNLDGEINSGDTGYKTGTQLVDVFRRTVATNRLEDAKFDDNQAVKNLVAYAKKFGLNMDNIQSVEDLYQWMRDDKKGYENTRELQNFIKNLPIELGDVLTNGESAGRESLTHISSVLEIQEQEREAAEKAATQKAKEFVDKYDSLLKERVKDAAQRANITQQLLSQLPGILMKEAQNMRQGLSVGTAVPLDQLVKGLSLGFSLGVDKDGKPNFGIYGAWDHDFLLGKGFDVSTGASVGTNIFFIPCGSAFIEFGYDVSEEERNKSLDAMGINRVSLGANCTMYGPIFSRGISAGYEQNKQGGIEKQARNINNQIKSHSLDLISAVQNKLDGQTDAESLKLKLKDLFPKSSEEELQNATNNLLQIISQFKIDENTTDKDRNIYAQVIADVYSEQWRNAALTGIADNKRKLSGGKVGIQFLAGFCPTVALVTKITRYYNARTNETEHSKMARIDAQVNGTGNKLISLEGKEVREDKVNQINEILKRYGATRGLSYFQGENGKPGRILVPEGVSDGIGINVRVSKTMEGCVREGGDGSYSFPANAVYRLLQETGGNQKSLTLNIGSDKSSDNDVLISDEEGMRGLIGENELMGAKKLEYTGKFESKGKIEYKPDFLDPLFTEEVKEGLKTIDSSDRRKFSEFMKTKVDGTKNFTDTIVTLIEILSKDKKYEGIVSKLRESSVSKEDKQLIADKVMAISADANVHHKWGLEAVVNGNGNTEVKGRGEYYKKMVGPNGQPIFSEINVDRDALVKKIHDNNNYKPELQPNLLGATAFYHKNNTAKGLAMTGLGVTTVLGGQKTELSWRDRFNAEKWFLGGLEPYTPGVLEKSPIELENMKNVISQKIGVNNILSNQLRGLLKGKEVEFTLDNSQKKVNVKLDVKYVFYLMGECANESVGMELGDLQVQEQQEVADYSQGELWLNSSDGASSVNVSRNDVAVGIAFGGKKKEEKPEEKPDYEDGSNPSDGPGPDDTIPEQEGGPIGDSNGEQNSDGSDGKTPDTPTDDVWTDGEKNGGDGPDAENQGDL